MAKSAREEFKAVAWHFRAIAYCCFATAAVGLLVALAVIFALA